MVKDLNSRQVVKMLEADGWFTVLQRGSHLHLKFVAAFVLIALVTTSGLFIVSAFFITQSIDKWFSMQVDRALEESGEVAESFYESTAQSALFYAARIAERISAQGQRDLGRLKREGVRIRVLGRREGLPEDISELVDKAERETAGNSDFFLNIAFNYGGREEIVRAAQKLADAVRSGDLDPDGIDEATFEGFLDTAGVPDPDLLIRTSGEFRLSNFLLWQAAYAELVFTDVLWPDFDQSALERAIAEFQSRERRFGAVSPGVR